MPECDIGDHPSSIFHIEEITHLITASEQDFLSSLQLPADVWHQPPLIFTFPIQVEEATPGKVHALGAKE